MRALLWVGLMVAISLLGYFALCIAGPASIELDSRLECPIHPSLLGPALEGVAEGHPWSEGPCRLQEEATGVKDRVVVCSELVGMEEATLKWWLEAPDERGTQLHQRFHSPLEWWSRGRQVLMGPPVIPSLTCMDLENEVARAWGAGEFRPFPGAALTEVSADATWVDASEMWWVSESGSQGEAWSTFQLVSPGNSGAQGRGLLHLPVDTVKTWSGFSDEIAAIALADFLSGSNAHSDSMESGWAVRRSRTFGLDTNETAPQWGTATLFEISFRAGSMDQHASD